MPDDLTHRWHRTLIAAREGATTPDPDRYANHLLTRWAEPQRRYHTTAHLIAVLDHIDTLAGHAADPEAVRLAAWFHDGSTDPTARRTRSAAPSWPSVR